MHWTWILPTLFTIGLFLSISVRYARIKQRGALTAATALRHKITPDNLAQAAVIFFYLLIFSSLSLGAWLIWALATAY